MLQEEEEIQILSGVTVKSGEEENSRRFPMTSKMGQCHQNLCEGVQHNLCRKSAHCFVLSKLKTFYFEPLVSCDLFVF